MPAPRKLPPKKATKHKLTVIVEVGFDFSGVDYDIGDDGTLYITRDGDNVAVFSPACGWQLIVDDSAELFGLGALNEAADSDSDTDGMH